MLVIQHFIFPFCFYFFTYFLLLCSLDFTQIHHLNCSNWNLKDVFFVISIVLSLLWCESQDISFITLFLLLFLFFNLVFFFFNLIEDYFMILFIYSCSIKKYNKFLFTFFVLAVMAFALENFWTWVDWMIKILSKWFSAQRNWKI